MKAPHLGLSRREREIMDILYQRGQASAAEVRDALSNPPSYSAVRAMLRILEEKGHIRHEAKDLRYVFMPTMSPQRAKRSALQHLLATFFNDSAEELMAALLDRSASELSAGDLERLSTMIESARRKGAGK
jgi:predicted transcriptional regulator